jgi:hypothetical protein
MKVSLCGKKKNNYYFMKTLKEFTEYINMVNDDVAIMRMLCRCELRAMKNDFCKHIDVKVVQNGYFPYFEYQIQTIDFKINNCMVVDVRYYADENKWTLIIGEIDREHIYTEVCVNDINIEQMVELITVLKRELFNY